MVQTFTGGLSNNVRQNVKDGLVSIRVAFRNPDGNYVDPSVPTGRFLYEGKVVKNVQVLLSTPGSDGTFVLSQVSTGIYDVSFLTVGMKPGLYILESWGQIMWVGKPIQLRSSGTIEIGEISMLQYYINRLRVKLMDDMVSWYRLDEPIHQWSASNLMACLTEALSHINNRGPRITYEAFETVPEDLIVTGGMIYALESRARIELANAMNYTDGHSLNIDRSPKYLQMAQQLRAGWDISIESWKRATPPTPIGLKSMRLPFRIFRVIGMLPNYQSYFEGLSA